MNTTTQSPQIEIHTAEKALRAVLDDEFRRDASSAAASLDRMVIHVANMQEAIVANPACRANVAKRLKDFAMTTSRMATQQPRAAEKLGTATEALKAAGAQVQEMASAVDEQRADAA